MKNNKGFSLVELIVVIAIMAILAAVAIPTFATFITKANVAADEDFANGVKYAVNLALTADGDEAATITVEMNNNGQGVKTLTYTLVGETNTSYEVIKNGAVVAVAGDNIDDEIAKTIFDTIDKDYKLKTNKVENFNGVTITKAAN